MALNDSGKGFAGALAMMAGIATGIYIDHEGEKLRAYKDVVGVVTICSGDTRNVKMGDKLTKEQCKERTEKIMAEYGTAVSDANPDIIDYPYMWGAFTTFTANIGINGYQKSGVKRLYEAGRYREACRYMLKYKYAGGRVYPGLVNRRAGTTEKIGEYELCLVDAIPRDLGNA